MNDLIRSMTLEYFAKGNHKISATDLLADENAMLLDIRSEAEMETLDLKLTHHIDVLHIPLNKLPDHLSEIPKDRTIGLFCSSGNRSMIAFSYLQIMGFNKVKNIEGGYASLIPELMPGKVHKRLA